jgi:TonB-linked SusC/RagA family outer membrane protein
MKKLLFCLMFLWTAGATALAQQTVSGVVTDADGLSLIGVNILEKGTANGTVTDLDGNFEIEVSPGATLVFSYTGYTSLEVEVGDRTRLDVTLEEGIALDEVVVTALGVEREKKALGYAVTELKGETLNTIKETNVINSLSGRVPGVVITRSAAGPGSGTRVVIRGNNSITGNNQPLFVVDGVPIDNSGFGGAAGAGTGEYARSDYGSGISDINPDDIESMTVLKGPNAAALYGSRASNGVILITTKKGSARKGLGVSFTSNITFESPLVLPEYQNEYGQGTDGNVPADLENLLNAGGSWGAPLDGSSKLYYNGETRPYAAQPNNVENFFRTGANYFNTLALEGGSDKLNARFSYSNTAANSILPNSGLNRHNFNLRTNAQLNDQLSLDAKITYFVQDGKNRPVQGTEGIMAYLYDIPRNVDVEDLKNFQNPANYAAQGPSSLGANPYWILFNDVNTDSRQRTLGFAKATYKFSDSFSAFARVGTDQIRQKIESINQFGHWFYGQGRFNFNETNITETNADFLLMFSPKISERFTLDINAGGNHLYQTREYIGVSGENFKIPTKPTTSSAQQLFPGYAPLQEKKVNSLYGAATIGYNNFVYLDLTARNDWSSALPEDNWSYFYPSASLSVMLNDFIDPRASVLDFLKLRVSVAQVGGDTDPYLLDNAFTLNQNGYLGLTTLSRPGTFYDENLKPERTTSTEIGTEFRLFKNRLYADVAYYSIESQDLIMVVPVTGLTGYSSFHTNVGKTTNKGVELMIGGVPVRTADFTWDISANFAKNENELVDLIEGLDNYIFSTTNNGVVTVQATVGGGFGEIWGTTYERSPSGDIVVDATGRPLATSEKVLLGNYQPDWTGGLNNMFRYKDLNLNVLIDARVGGQLYSGTDAGLDASGVSARSLEYRETGVTVDGVVNTGTSDNPVYEPNTEGITAQQYFGAISGIASEHIYDQTNIRLREVSLMYRVPGAVLGNTFIKGLSIGFVGRNLLFLTKDLDYFDPESSYSTSNFAQGVLFYNLPTTRTYGVNISARF